MSVKVGSYARKCIWCNSQAFVMRIGRDSLTCRCELCNTTFKASKEEQIKLKAKPIKPKAPKKNPTPKRVKKPVVRTIAGLKGRCEGKGRLKEWHFTYRTKCAPLLLRAHKRLGYWSVSFGNLNIGSGETMIEALEQAKRRMSNRGHELV